MKHPLTRPSRRRRPDSFTLIEMLVVLLIISILVGLTLAAASGVMKTASRDRAKTEIAAMAGALESYKSDQGQYPIPSSPIFNSTNDYTTALASASSGKYTLSSAFLYEQLTGHTNYSDLGTAPTSPSYITFKSSQLANDSASASAPIYIKDPFGNSYGYYCAAANASAAAYPNNGQNQYDLWSTAGDVTGTKIVTWVTDWNN